MQWPPIHPMLVNFTAALVPVSVLSDLAGALLNRQSLRHTAWWTLCLAAAMTPFTVLAGWLWLFDLNEPGRTEMTIHQWLGTALAVVLLCLALWRGRLHLRDKNPNVLYFIALVVVFAALAFQGHVGAMMSFGSESIPT